jgi:hypothetical protein
MGTSGGIGAHAYGRSLSLRYFGRDGVGDNNGGVGAGVYIILARCSVNIRDLTLKHFNGWDWGGIDSISHGQVI